MTTKQSQRSTTVKFLLIGCGALSVLLLCGLIVVAQNFVRPLFVTIGPDEVGVVISPFEVTGLLERPLTSGNHMIRLGEHVEIYKISRETFSSSSAPGCCTDGSGGAVIHAKDDKTITAYYQIVYGVDPQQVIKLHQNWQHHYKSDYVIPQSKRTIEKIAGAYSSDEIIFTRKAEIEQSIFTELSLAFSEEGLYLSDFKFGDIRLKE